jgi:hypothetical protein
MLIKEWFLGSLLSNLSKKEVQPPRYFGISNEIPQNSFTQSSSIHMASETPEVSSGPNSSVYHQSVINSPQHANTFNLPPVTTQEPNYSQFQYGPGFSGNQNNYNYGSENNYQPLQSQFQAQNFVQTCLNCAKTSGVLESLINRQSGNVMVTLSQNSSLDLWFVILKFVYLALENTVTTSVTEIKVDIKELLRRCNLNIADNPGVDSPLPIALPLANSEGLTILDSWLNSADNITTLVSILCHYLSLFCTV